MTLPLLQDVIEDSEFVVISHRWRTPVIAEIGLRPVREHMNYVAGQYVLISDTAYDIPVRSYSVANAPEPSGLISVFVTEVPGGATSTWLTRRLQVGDTVLVSGPYGTFVRDPASRAPVTCLAGGSGLAPIRALAQEAVCGGLDLPFTVIFSARTERDVVDQDLFDSWSARAGHFRFVRTLTRSDGAPPLGRIPDVLTDIVPDLTGHDVFVCGSPGFVKASANAARSAGAAAGQVHTEEFFAEPEPWTSASETEA